MNKKTIYRTLIALVVLSEEPIPENMDMQSIWDETQTGEFLAGGMKMSTGRPLVGKTAVIEIEKAGSQPEFFNMDAQGYPLEYDSEEGSAMDNWINNVDSPQD